MNELIQRAQQGDDRAFVQLFERHKLELWKAAMAVLNNPDDAADALQDAVLKAWKAFPSFEGRSAVGTWLMRILLRASYDIQRKRLREVPRVMDGSSDGAAGLPAADAAGAAAGSRAAGAAGNARERDLEASREPDRDLVLDVRGAMASSPRTTGHCSRSSTWTIIPSGRSPLFSTSPKARCARACRGRATGSNPSIRKC